MELTHIVVFLSWILGGFISGATGIGGAMVAFPIAAMLIPMHTLIPLACVLNVAMDIGIVCLYGRYCSRKELWPMLLGTIPGSVLGLYILQIVSGSTLLGSVGIVLLLYIVWQCTAKPGAQHAPNHMLGALGGFFSGVLGSSVSFDGPPVGMYALYRGWSPHQALGTLGVYFTLRGTFACCLLAHAGMLGDEVVSLACYGVPGVAIGIILAIPVASRLNAELFRRVLLAIIACAGVICLWRAL